MIIIDTHILIWWIDNSPLLKAKHRNFLENQKEGDVALSIISCWEIAKSAEKGKLKFKIPVEKWLEQAIENSKISLVPLDIKIISESTQLPENFHKDPADQLIVATARTLDIELLTADTEILKYPHVKKFHL